MANLFKNLKFGSSVVRRDGIECVYIANDGKAPFKYRVRLLSDHTKRLKEIEEMSSEGWIGEPIRIEEPIMRNSFYNGDYYVKFNGAVTACTKWKCKEDIVS